MTEADTQLSAGVKTSRIVFLGSLSVFFIFAAHYLQVNRAGVGLELPFNAMGWIPLSFAVGAGLYAIVTHGAFRYTSLSVRLIVLCCLLVLPFFLPMANQDMALDRMLGLLAGLLLFLGLQQFNLDRDKDILLLFLVIVAVWVELVIGWDRFLRSLGIGVSESRPVWSGPPHGVFQQRNVFASLIATGIVLSGYLLAFCVREYGSRFQPRYLVLLLLPLAGIYLLIAMYSRTGWLGAALGVLLVLPFLWTHAGRYFTGAWLISVAAGFLLAWSLSGSSTWEGPSRGMMTMEGLRQIHFPQTLSMVADKPVLGYGYGRFESAYLNYTADRYARGESDIPGIDRLDHPHNELLFWAAEGGLYALVIVLMAAWFVWRRVVALPWQHRLAMIGLFFPIVLHTQLEYPFYQSALHWIIFILLIYWVDRLSAEPVEQQVRSTLLIRVSAILIPPVTTIFMLTTLHSGYLLARFESGEEPNVGTLFSITNPMVWEDRLNWAIMSRLVLNGAVNNAPEQVKPYIQWAPELLERKPRPNFYRFLILAYQVAGDEENMERVQRQARYLFPGVSFETPNIEAGLAAPVPFDAISR